MSVFQPPSGKGRPYAYMNCVDETGTVDRATVSTLLNVVQELTAPELERFRSLITEVKGNKYDLADFQQPQWTGNACAVWFGQPVAGPNHVLISNCYVPEYSADIGKPQRFSLAQLELAMDAWRAFTEEVSVRGLEGSIGKSYELKFPD
jgi:hypothetical protein